MAANDARNQTSILPSCVLANPRADLVRPHTSKSKEKQ